MSIDQDFPEHEISSIKTGLLTPSEKSLLLLFGKLPTLVQKKDPNIGLKDLHKTSAAVKLKFGQSKMLPQ